MNIVKVLSDELAYCDNVLLNRIALIPAYNEERFIGSVVLQALKHVDRVVVVDDGSVDDTALIAEEAGAEVLSLPKNVGKAQAVSEGIRHIRRLRPTAVVMIDGDGQHDAKQIPTMLAPIEAGKADMVIGDRQVTTIRHFSPLKKFLQKFGSWVVRQVSGTDVPDAAMKNRVGILRN